MLDWLADHPEVHRRLLFVFVLALVAALVGWIAGSGWGWGLMTGGWLIAEAFWAIRDFRRSRPPGDPPPM